MSKIVIIKTVEKQGGWSKVARYANTKDYITPYYQENKLKYTGLNTADAERLGKELQVDLNPRSEFWTEYAVVMTDKPKRLDLDIPEDELAYKFLSGGHFRVAKSITDIEIGSKDYYIIDETKEAEVTMNKAAFEIKAISLFGKLTTENKKDILKLYAGFVNTDNVSPEIVDARLYEQLKKDPKRFVELAEDKKRDMKVLLKDLVSAKILRKNKSSYYYAEDFIGHDEESAITYIEDPSRQSLKIDLMSQLNKSK